MAMSEPYNLATATEDFQIDPSLADDEGIFLPEDDQEPIEPEATQAELDEATASAITASLAEASQQQVATPATGRLGDEKTPNPNPIIHLAPFSKPNRGENTPYPEHLEFINRADFEVWLSGESSWCHYVQRRTTTPEKRAEERMRARLKAHERALAAMTSEEASTAPPLKKRRRLRTSPIQEKITYTCHHAGSYESKHSTSLPQEKLRLNTKKSVKCNCNSRIVLTEMQDLSCKAVYFWKHEGHDPFAEDELESGRLPKIIDDWLIAQIQAGKDTESIRKLLQMTDEEKEEYLKTATNDPASLPPDMPPPLALSLKVKYPDIYNRYRKLKGPIKATKPLKTRRAGVNRIKAEATPVGETSLNGITAEDAGVEHQFVDGTGDMEMDQRVSVELARLASKGHVDLAQALLRLPRGGQEGEQVHLDEAMLRMARMESAGAQEERSETAWDAINM